MSFSHPQPNEGATAGTIVDLLGVSYTQYFEDGRKGKNAAKLINPNDPLQNPEAFHQNDPPIHTYPSRAPCSQVSTRVKHEQHKSREDVDVNRDVKYMSTENLATHKHVSSSPNWRHDQGNLGHPLRKPNHSNDELEHSIGRFPIQAKVPFLLLQEKGDPYQISMV